MIRRLFVVAALAALLQAPAYAQDPSASATLSSTTCPGSGCIALTNLASRSMATVEASGSWTGTLLVEITASWTSVPVFAADSRAKTVSITANGTYLVPIGGAASVRVRASVLSAGSAVVRITAGQGSGDFELPAGSATAANQATANASLSSVDTKTPALVSGRVPVDGSGVTQPVSAASLPLPTGAATLTAQGTGNTSLASIDGKLGASSSAVSLSASGLVVRPVPLQRSVSATVNGIGSFGTVDVTGAPYVYWTIGTANLLADVKCRATDTVTIDMPMQSVQLGSNVGQFDQYRVDLVSFNGSLEALTFACAVPSWATTAYISVQNYTSGTGALLVTASTNPPVPAPAEIYASGGGLNSFAHGVLVGGKNSNGDVFRPLPIRNGPIPTSSDLEDGLNVHIVSATDYARTIVASALPSGAATSANQATAQTTLASIKTDVDNIPAQGQALASASMPVVLPAAQVTTLTPPAAITGFALDATLTGGTQQSKITDGSNVVDVKAASTAASATDKALVVAVSPNNTVGVTGTFFQSTQPVSSTQLPAALAANGGLKIEGVASGVAVPVSGTFFQGTQPVSLSTLPALTAGSAVIGHVIADSGSTTAVTALPALVAGSAVIGHVIADSGSTTAVTGTVTVSGTVTANAGSNLNTSALSLSATQTDRTQKTQLTDGTRDGTVKAASTLPALSDTAVVTTQRDPLPAGANVIGHVIADTGSTTAVTALPALVAGSAVIGHVIADASAAVIGHVIADTGSTTAVTALPALVAGSAVIGHVIADASAAVIGHVVADTGSTTAVTQATGSNLHAVIDTGSTTAVTQATPASLQATVTPIALTKATQGATGFSTQDLKDAGRTSVMITASVASTAATETLITLTRSVGLAATGTCTSCGITTGKRLRIQAITISARNSTGTTTSNVTVNFRAAAAGTTSASSPLQMHYMVNVPASTATVLFPETLIPDGFEIDANGATNTYGVTIIHPQWVTGSVVVTFDITIVGYEY